MTVVTRPPRDGPTSLYFMPLKSPGSTAAIMGAAGGDMNVSVNISAKQLREPDFVTKIERALTTMDGAGLVLEITERDLAVGDRHPVGATVCRPEHAAAGDAHIEGARLRRDTGHRSHASAA